jgi:hypothetical protein
MDCMCESCDGGDCSRCGFSLQDDYEDGDDWLSEEEYTTVDHAIKNLGSN